MDLEKVTVSAESRMKKEKKKEKQKKPPTKSEKRNAGMERGGIRGCGGAGHLGASNKSFLRLVVTVAAPDESAPPRNSVAEGGEVGRQREEAGTT